ncbi:hypothetical protein MAR_021782 [Mya arenaria]|uniref:Uncharacterized protein n=1 Tax=Mya arenaria TaxID=6604 RepID=A0ABY7ECH5_MYAAR|nr:hypothetical protein MAR_021782 [Mya arenaria]
MDRHLYHDANTDEAIDTLDNVHVYTPLDAPGLKTHVSYENVKDDPVYNNTVLKDPIQTVL